MKTIKVLLIDDDVNPREGIASYLRDVTKIEVDEFDNGQTALDQINHVKGDYCAILLDLVLGPPLSGLDVLHKLRKDYPGLPVIVFTGKDATAGVQALELGANRFMRKPVDPAEMGAIVRSLAEQDMILRELAVNMRQFSQADMCIVWQLDKSRQQFRVAAWAGTKDLDKEYRQTISIDAKDPVIHNLIVQGKPAYLPDVTNPESAPYYKHRQEAIKRGWKSLITVPLIRQGRVITLLDNYWEKLYTFRDKEEKNSNMEMMAVWANLAAKAIINTEISSRFQALLGINRLLAEALEEKDIIELILSKGLELVGTEIGCLYLVDFETKELILKACQGIPSIKSGDIRRLGAEFSKIVVKTGITLNISDTTKDPRSKEIERVKVFSVVAVPLRREEQTIGVLTAMSQFCNNFTNDDINLLTAFASQATLAVERARLNKCQRRISETALTTDVQDLHQSVVNTVYSLTGKYASLWLLDTKEQVLRIAAYKGGGPGFKKSAILNIKGSVSGQAIENHEIVTRTDFFDPDVYPPFTYLDEARKAGWRSAMIVPLFDSMRQPIGTLNVYGLVKQEFTRWEKDLLSSFANQVAIAFENASQLNQAKTLQRVLNAVSSAIEPKPDNVARKILSELNKVVEFRRASIQLFQGDSRRLVAGYGFDLNNIDQRLVRPISQDPLVRKIVTNKKTLILSNTSDDLDWETLPGMEEIKSWVGIPLIKRGKVIGLLTLDHDREVVFPDVYRELFDRIGNLVSIAMQKSKMLADLRLLNRFSHDISSILDDENAVYEAIPEAIVRTLGCSHCTIFVTEDDQLKPHTTFILANDPLMPHISYPKKIKIARCFSLGEGLVGWAAKRKRSILAPDAKKNKHFSKGMTKPDNERSMIVMPIKRERKVVAVISADQDWVNAFDENDLQMVETLAIQAGISLQNINLLKQEQQRADAMNLLQRIGAEISKPLDLDNVLAKIIEGAMELTHTESGIIRLVEIRTGKIIYEYPMGFDHPPSRFPERTGTTWEIVNKKKPIVTSDISKDFRINSQLIAAGVKAMIGVPLIVDNEAIGALFLNDTTMVREFSEDEQNLLKSLADQAAVVINKSRILDTTEKQRKELEAINKITKLLMETLDPDKIYQSLLLEVIPLLRVEAGSIWIVDNQKNQVECKYPLNQYGEEDDVTRALKNLPQDILTSRKGIVRRIINTGNSQRVHDVKKDLDWNSGVDEITGFTTRSIMAIPLKHENKVIAVMELLNKLDESFTPEDEKFASAIASVAALALDNARLYKQRGEDIGALQEVNATITKSGWREVAELITQKAADLTGAKQCALFVANWEEKHLDLGALYGGEPKEAWIPIDKKSINGLVAMTGKPHICPDVSIDPYYLLWDINIESSITVPMKFKDEIIGTLSVESDQLDAFSAYQLELLQSLANQAAIALKNTRYFRELAKRADQLERFHKIATTISAKQTNLNDVLKLIVDSLQSMYQEASCAIRLYNPDRKELGLFIAVGALRDQWEAPRPNGTTWYVIKNQSPVYIEDISNPQPDGMPSVRIELIEQGVRALAYLPLVFENIVIGILYLNLNKPYKFTEDEKRMLDIFANDAAIVIRNANLLNRERQRANAMNLLQQIGAEISKPLDLDNVLAKIIEGAMKLTHTDSGIIHLVDISTITTIISYEYPKDFDHSPSRFSEKRGIIWDIVNTGKLIAISDISKDTRVNPELITRGVKSIIGVPLIVNNEAIGVLFLHTNVEVREFSEDEQNLLRTLADQAAVIINKSRLLDTTEKQRKELETVNNIAMMVMETLDPDKIYQSLLREVIPLLKVEAGSIWIVDDKIKRGEYKYSLNRNGEEDDVTRALNNIPPAIWTSKRGIVQKVFKSGKSQIVIDVTKYPDWNSDIDKITGFTTRSIMAIPLKRANKIIAIMELMNKLEGSFTGEDVKFASAIASVAALALDNARLYKQRGEDIGALQEVNATITKSGWREVAELITQKAAELTGAKQCGLFVVNREEKRLDLGALYGGEPREAWILINKKNINGLVAMTGKPYFCPDVGIDPYYLLWDSNVKSTITVPMKFKDEIIGTLSVESDQLYAFSAYQLELLQSLANQAAIAIENARLYQQLKSRLSTTERQREALQRLASLNELAGRFIHKVGDSTGLIPHNIDTVFKELRTNAPNHDVIYQELDEINASARELLDMAKRIQDSMQETAKTSVPGFFEKANIKELLDDALIQARRRKGEYRWSNRIKINKPYITSSPMEILTVRVLFREALVNLITNAIEAMPQGGVLTLDIKSQRVEGIPYAVVEIKDTGMGIPQKDLTNIFDIDYCKKTEGFGFGLWFVKYIFCDATDTLIEVKSILGEGTSFFLSMPLAGTRKE